MLYPSICRAVVVSAVASLMLSGCFSPPHNNFKNENRVLKGVVINTGIGVGVGAAVGSMAGNTAAGAAIGGVAGAIYGLSKNNKEALIEELKKQDIQYVEYGDTRVLIVPTDRYFVFNSHRIHDLCYRGMNNIVRLLKYYPCSPIYVAGFTDDIGSRTQKEKLSQSRADAFVTFLWANDIHAQRLHAEGYGDLHPVGDNNLIHGSAYNRRIEIQWIKKDICPQEPVREPIDSK